RDKEPGWPWVLRFRRLDGRPGGIGRRSLGFHTVRVLGNGRRGALGEALADLGPQIVGLDELVAVQEADERGEQPERAHAAAAVSQDSNGMESETSSPDASGPSI